MFFNWFRLFIVSYFKNRPPLYKNLFSKMAYQIGLSNRLFKIFCRKGLTNPSLKFNSERVYQIRRQWYLSIRGWQIRRKNTTLKNGYNGARSDPKHVIEMGSIFLPKGLNKSVVKIQFRKGLSNPSSMVFSRKGLINPSIHVK